ncbi:DNA-binding protein [Variovorax sp. J22R133]|uniref:DNA-binding protein n=1 Tax=Variovorax brevis TaxID=3053503 RepID=UPI002574BD87|nr:DNA-binding protein [Variovorax sp. J22R133]MDM0116142.1 DNA-binding protein [Variovorax sp. J22R133]
MSEIREIRSTRGIQEEDVFKAADALLAEGLRPTIERVRLKIGRGSPNTVSPMLERWFGTLASRLAGGVNPSANLAAGNDADGVPVSVRNATRLLWETARREAEDVQRQELESARAQLEEAGHVLAVGQADLAQREAAFEQARVSLDAALASSQQAREGLERQLGEQAAEIARLRATSEQEIARLNALLQESHASKEVLRQEQAAALAERDKDLRKERESHEAQERHSHEEVDRARQDSKQLEAVLAREQQQRLRSEEAAAQTLEAGRRMVRETQQAAQHLERELRDQLVVQSGSLVQAQSQVAALQQRLDDLARQMVEEKQSHAGTRALLATALADMGKPGAARRKAARKTR